MSKGIVLVADDDAAIRTVINQALSRAGFDVRVTSNASTLWRWIDEGEGDVVVSDVIMPDGDAFDLLPRIKLRRPELPVIVMSAQNTFMTAIKASETGAYEYLPKPFDLSELIAAVDRAISEPKDNRSTEKFDEYLEGMPLVGRSPPMQEIYRSIARLMQSDLTVMLTGEPGTGKLLTAKVLHQYGNRKNNPFMAVNLAVLPPDSIEAELFGSTSTNSTENIDGKIKQAAGGILFLKEVAELPASAQSRLLRVLQLGEFTPVGGASPIKSDVKIIASTTRDMDQMIRNGMFREDLFYQLNVVPLRIPPLRERQEDVADLVFHFLKLTQMEGGQPKHADQEALKALKDHSWPGNVRELENLVRRICTLYPQETITGQVVETEIRNSGFFRQGADNSNQGGFNDLRSATEFFLNRYFAKYGEELPPEGVYHRFLDEFEHPVISSALTATNGNQIKAAEVLGLNRNTLRKKIRDHGIRIVRTTR